MESLIFAVIVAFASLLFDIVIPIKVLFLLITRFIKFNNYNKQFKLLSKKIQPYPDKDLTTNIHTN